jgi:hypothetical protein
MTEPLLLLLVAPASISGLCLLLFGRSWAAALTGVGLLGLGLAGIVDVFADNCTIGACTEKDSSVLTAVWWLSLAALGAGALGMSVRMSRRRQRV